MDVELGAGRDGEKLLKDNVFEQHTTYSLRDGGKGRCHKDGGSGVEKFLLL